MENIELLQIRQKINSLILSANNSEIREKLSEIDTELFNCTTKEELEKIQQRVDLLILMTPTSEIREKLTEINMDLMQLIDKAK